MDETLRPTFQIKQRTLLIRMTFNNEDTARKIRSNIEAALRNKIA